MRLAPASVDFYTQNETTGHVTFIILYPQITELNRVSIIERVLSTAKTFQLDKNRNKNPTEMSFTCILIALNKPEPIELIIR